MARCGTDAVLHDKESMSVFINTNRTILGGRPPDHEHTLQKSLAQLLSGATVRVLDQEHRGSDDLPDLSQSQSRAVE